MSEIKYKGISFDAAQCERCGCKIWPPEGMEQHRKRHARIEQITTTGYSGSWCEQHHAKKKSSGRPRTGQMKKIATIHQKRNYPAGRKRRNTIAV